jgi:pimeloyl-ACP methyl ester carboxylesterase
LYGKERKKKMKKFVWIVLCWLMINLIAWVLFFKQAYKVSWVIFGSFSLMGVLAFITFIITLAVYLFIWLGRGQSFKLVYLIKQTGLLFVVFTSLALVQVFVSTGFDYHPGDGQVSRWETVKLNGTQQTISVRTEDESNPVILFLAGGPGGSQIQATRQYLSDLESDYTIINWEQPGSGKSYTSRKIDTLTPDTYINDGHALTSYLKERYQQEKIYLIGESWGSYLAINLATQYPEDYYAIITTGQMVDFAETEQYCYDKALEVALEKNDTQQIEALLKLGPVPLEGDNIAIESGTYLMYLHQYMAHSDEINESSWDTFDSVFSPEYTIMDSFNFLRALYFTFSQVYQQLYETDLRESHTTLSIPLHILHGRHDLNAPTYLVDEYYDLIEAPEKSLTYFEHSGHNPWITESDRFNEKVKDIFQYHV